MRSRYVIHLTCGCSWGGGKRALYCPLGEQLRAGLAVARASRTDGPDHQMQYEAYLADFRAHCRALQ